MPEGKISLEEGLSDSPQVRAEVAKLEKYLPPFREYATLLRDTFQACHIHQEKVCEGTDALSKLLNSFQGETIGEQDTFTTKAFFRLSRYLGELNSCQEMLSTQLQNAVIELLSQFISTDFNNLEKLKENHKIASLEHEQAAAKFSRCSKKKDSEKARFEANAELFSARKKFYETSLDYYSELNCFQHKKKFAIMEPMLTFMHAQMAYFKVGHEILSSELANLLTGLNTEVQQVHKEYQDEMLSTVQARADIELRFHTLCLPDPDPADPFLEQPLMPNTRLTSKAGYLFVRTQSSFPAKWDRAYFFTKKGYLYIHLPPKPPELIINLKGAEATATDVDDRRYAFAINHSSLKRPIYLMAESDIQKDEWISTVNNIGYDSVHAQPRMNTKKDEAVIRLEREKIRSWVNKEIDPKKDKSSVPKIPKVSPTPTPSTSTSQISAFPSLSTFLNFLDPTSQSNQSENPPQKKSPIFQRKASSNPKPIETSGGDFGGVSIPHPKELPSPLQPERLTAGAVSASSRQNQFSYSKSFSVKYLGHMEVPEGRNISVITDTIQKVMTARAVRNVKDSQAIEMTVSNKSISLYDNHAKKPIGQILLKDILRCAVQPESIKLFGVVNRTTEGDKVKFICHVMEANTTGSQVCSAINEAIQSAIKMIQAGTKHARSRSGNVATRSLRESVEHPSPSRQAPKNATESKPPSRPPPPKPKSTSDSNILSTVSNPLPSSITSSQSSLNSALSDDSTDGGPMAPPPPMSSGYLPNPAPVFNTMPLLPENKATTNPPGQGGMGGSSSVHVPQQNGTSSPQSNGNNTVSWNMMSAAASSSDYYQMPSTLQGGGAASQGGGVTSQGGGMPVMDSFSDGDLDSPLPPLDDLVSSPTTSDPYGSGGERKETSASVSVDSGYFQMPHMQHSADTSSQLATPVMGGSGSVDSGSSYLASPMMGVSGSVDSGSASFAAGGGSGSVDSGSAYFIAPGSTSSTLNGSGSVDSGSAYIFAPNATSSILNGSGSVDSGSASKPALGGSGCADSGGNGLVDSGSSLKPPLFGGSGLVDSGSAYLPAPGVTSDGIGGNNVVSANGFEDPGCLSSSDTVFDVSSSSQQSAGFDAIFGGGVASTSNSGYLPAPMGAESASATPNQSAESFFTPGNVSSSSVGGFPGSFPGMGGGAEGEEDLDDFDLPPLPDSVEPLPPTGQGGVSSYGGSFVTFGSTRTQH